MKLLIFAVALVASACAYSVEDIPMYMRERLDRYIVIKKQWEVQWSAMTESEQRHYEEIIVERLEHLPEIERNRYHDRLVSLPLEHRIKMRDFMRKRFAREDISLEKFEDEVEEIESIADSLPELIRIKLQQTLAIQLQEATAYHGADFDSELDFEDIPEIVEITEATGYSDSMPEDIRSRLDEFLLKRENWRRKWENLSSEKREALEEYINSHL
jgi:hypothetical protein